MFYMMKKDGLQPDVIAYTAMLHAYSASGESNNCECGDLRMFSQAFQNIFFFARALGASICSVSRNGAE